MNDNERKAMVEVVMKMHAAFASNTRVVVVHGRDGFSWQVVSGTSRVHALREE